jgi:hypothetical protein
VLFLKRPEVVDPDERGRVSCRTVSEVFEERPWVIEVRETEQNSTEDGKGIDMFVRVEPTLLRVLKIDGGKNVLSVQIKSSGKRANAFIRKHTKRKRFFNIAEKNHLFVLCGMEEKDLVLADIIGQIVVHVSGFGMSERKILNCLKSFGDKRAVSAYERNKVLLLFRWYGSRLPSLK